MSASESSLNGKSAAYNPLTGQYTYASLIATDIPGFAVDEPVATLGQDLKLPSFLEGHRKEIEAVLQPLGKVA